MSNQHGNGGTRGLLQTRERSTNAAGILRDKQFGTPAPSANASESAFRSSQHQILDLSCGQGSGFKLFLETGQGPTIELLIFEKRIE